MSSEEVKLTLSQITRKTFTTLSQLKNYTKYGLFVKKNINEKYLFSARDVKKLYYIKLLSKMNFHLRDINYILNNLPEENLNKTLKYYYNSFDKDYHIFKTNFSLIIKSDNETKIYGLENFKLLNNSILMPVILTKLFEYRKVWYLNQEIKNKLRKLRKEIYKCFTNYNISKKQQVYPQVSLYFCELFRFLQQQNLAQWMYFLCFIEWLVSELRYVKEMKKYTKTSVACEIFQMALTYAITELKEY